MKDKARMELVERNPTQTLGYGNYTSNTDEGIEVS